MSQQVNTSRDHNDKATNSLRNIFSSLFQVDKVRRLMPLTSPRPENVHLLTLPQEILNEIYAHCTTDITAIVQQPSRKQISRNPDAALAPGNHVHRFMFRSHGGQDVTLPLLGVCKALRYDYIHFIAALLPLKLCITAYAPSQRLPPHLILPSTWAERVKHITVPRFIASLAALPCLSEGFTNLKSMTVDYTYTSRLPLGSPWAYTRFRKMDALRPVVQRQTESEEFHALLREEFERSLRRVLTVFEGVQRDFRIGVRLRFGCFTVDGKVRNTRAKCDAIVSRGLSRNKVMLM